MIARAKPHPSQSLLSFKPNPKRLGKRKRVTLIAGFKSTGGVVLCADSRESDGLAKGEVDKLVEYSRDWCSIGFAGAGNDADIIDSTIEQITDALEQASPTNLLAIKATVRNALAGLPISENPAGLLMAVCPSENPHAELWAVADRHLHTVSSGRQVMGVGQYVRFVAERLYRNDLTLHEAMLVAVQLLVIAKKHVSDVEGTSHILILQNGGWLTRERIDEVEAREQFFEWLDAAWSHVYLTIADTGKTKAEFEQALEKFNETVRTLRDNYFEAFKDSHLGEVRALAAIKTK